MIHLDQDIKLHITLAASVTGAAAAAPASSAATPAAARTAPRKDGSVPSDDFVHKAREGKPARAIDNSDPYGP